jgi:hypothetical protein
MAVLATRPDESFASVDSFGDHHPGEHGHRVPELRKVSDHLGYFLMNS